MLDSHCHVNELVYGSKTEVDQIINRAKQAGVKILVTIGSGYGVEASRSAVDTARRHSGVYASVGVHPHDAKEWNKQVRDGLLKHSMDEKVVALGEMGLDFHCDRSSRAQQRMVFREQLRLAKQYRLPIIIHDRDSNGEVLDILKQEKAFDDGVLFHCFCGGIDEMCEIVRLGGSISIPGIVTFNNAAQMQAVVQAVPMDRLLVETDSPFLTPAPLRGQRNEPANVSYVIDKIAVLRSMNSAIVAQKTEANAKRFFDL